MERTLDAKGRWRNRTVGFRVSELLQTIQMVAVTLNGMKEEAQHVESPEQP